LYIYAFSNFTSEVTDKISDKKPLLSTKFNRTDNFINLVLLGAQNCVKDISLDKDTSIYIASRNGNLNTTFKVMDSIFLKHKLPMPFNFLNSVNAAILFFVAKCFRIEGKTLFVDRFDSAFPQAVVDLKQGKTVLLGVVEEVMDDLEFYRSRFGDKLEESSRWLLISPKLCGIEPIAKVYDLDINSKFKADDSMDNLFNFFENKKKVFDFQGNNLFFRLEKI